MDEIPISKKYADESSLESSDTTIVEQPQVSKNPKNLDAIAASDNATFVGYRPPKPKPLYAFILKHWVRLTVGGIALVVGAVSAGIIMASSREKDVQLAAPTPNRAELVVPQAESVEDEKPTKSDTIAAQYSFDKSGKMFKLVSDGEIWLERSEAEWMKYTTADEWLFFAANKTPSGTNPDSGVIKVGIEAFNFKTKLYVTLGELDPPPFTSLQTPMSVQNGYLYISLSGQRLGGVTYRCKLDREKACAKPELYYNQPGTIHAINGTEAYVLETTADGESYSYKLKRLALESRQVTELKKGAANKEVGEKVVGFSNDGLVWIAQSISSSPSAATTAVQLERLTAYDSSGDQKFVLTPESFPLVEPYFTVSNDLKSHEILLVSGDRQVVFDMNKKEFGSIQKRSTSEQPFGLPEFLESAGETFRLPSLFSMKEVL